MEHTLHFREAMQLLLADKPEYNFKYEAEEELRAIISHWLQDISSPPIWGSPELAKLWHKKLLLYATSGSSIANKNSVLKIQYDIPFPPNPKGKIKFIDLIPY